jgi:hypothetical protein
MGSWESGVGLHGEPAAPTQGDFNVEFEAQLATDSAASRTMIVMGFMADVSCIDS